MFFCFASSRCLEELSELDRLIDRNAEQVADQRNVLASDDCKGAKVVQKFLEDLLSAQIIYIADRQRLLIRARG
jgi:hypothetical protein